MRQKLFNFSNHSLKVIFYILFTLTFFFALTSPNLILGDNAVTKIGTTAVSTIFLLLAGAIFLLLYVSKTAHKFFYKIFIKNNKITATIFLLIVIVLQIIFVQLTHPAIGFDVGAIHYGLTNPRNINTIGYFSVNPNNVNLLLIQHWFATQFKMTSWLFFDYLTLILVDLSAIFNLFSIGLIDKTKVPLAMYLHALWLILFPMILVPYTDTWVLPLVSLYLLCYCFISYTKVNFIYKLPVAIIFGVAISCAYFVKPSGIIPAIAILIVELLRLLVSTRKMWATLLLVILVAGSAYGGYHVFNQSIQKQTYIRVNTFRAKPIVHFINMGLSGDGGYNEKDSFKMATTISKQARIDYSVHSIKKRLKKMGPFGYVKFLLQKQGNNSADGTFAWIKEGNFIHGSSIPKQHGVAGVIDNFIYLYGTNLGDFRFIAQIFWCICLGIIFFAWDDTRKITQIMRLTIIGGFIFLLIFEGGRSRYLIQFLPAFLILATLNFHATKQKLHDLFSWTKTSKD